MATVTYTRTYSYSNVNDYYKPWHYFKLNASSFTAPSGYTWSSIQFTTTKAHIAFVNQSSSIRIWRGSQAVLGTYDWAESSSGPKTYTYTDSTLANASAYAYYSEYCIRTQQLQTSTGVYIENPKIIIAFKKTFNVTKGNPIKKTDFDAIGWAATVGQKISHSGMSGIIYASTFNSQSTTTNEAISGTVTSSS